MAQIQPIETVYNGYRFRSRLEARWAVFFDAMGFDWTYEKEGFHLGDIYYLPDFWIEDVKYWAEVKSEKFTSNEKRKCELLVLGSKRPCLLLNGIPDFKGYTLIECISEKPKEDLVIIDKAFIQFGYFRSRRRFEFTDEIYDGDKDGFDLGYQCAVKFAKQARFEHGKTPDPMLLKLRTREIELKSKAIQYRAIDGFVEPEQKEIIRQELQSIYKQILLTQQAIMDKVNPEWLSR